MRSHRSAAVTVVTALVVLLAGEAAARAVAGRMPDRLEWGSREAQVKLHQLERTRGVDVLLVGNSMVDVGIDPVRLAARLPGRPRAYNAAVSGMPARSLDRWVEAALLPRAHPRLLVLGVSPRDLNDNGRQEAVFDASLRSSLGYRRATGTMSWRQRLDASASDASRLVALREYWRDPGDALRCVRGRRVPTWSFALRPGGQKAPKDQAFSTSQSRRREIRAQAFNDFHVGGVDTRALRAAVLAGQRSGATVVLLSMPVDRGDLVPLMPRGAADADAFDEVVRRVGADTGARVLEPQADFPGTTWFHDEYHLNAAGAARLTDWLAARLAA